METETSEGLPLLSCSPNTTVPCFLFFTVYTDTLLNCSSIMENSSWAYASSLDSRWAPQDGIQVVCGALVRAAAQLSSMDYSLLGAFLLDSRKPIAVRSSKISKIWREVLTCFWPPVEVTGSSPRHDLNQITFLHFSPLLEAHCNIQYVLQFVMKIIAEDNKGKGQPLSVAEKNCRAPSGIFDLKHRSCIYI